MQELGQCNTNRGISLLTKFQSFLENVFLQWIKNSSVLLSPVGGTMFHRNKSILVDPNGFCIGGEFPGKRECRNLGFLHHDKLQTNLLFCRDLACALSSFTIRVIRTDRLSAEITVELH